jgi:NADH-quinone oxidoreductase subunit L
MHDDQDMRHMGGLFRFMPITASTFIVGWLAIAGIPPFSGFWSKDEILIYAWNDSKAIWFLGSIAALLTAFYMSRQVFMVFFGDQRWRELSASDAPVEADAEDVADAHAATDADTTDGDEADAHEFPAGFTPHESPWLMTVPLVVLSVFALLAGGMNLPFTQSLHYLNDWLEPSVFGAEAHLDLSAETKWAIAIFSTLLSVVGVIVAALIYLQRRFDPAKVELRPFAEGWWIDSTFANFVGGPGRKAFDLVAWFDKNVVDGAVNGVAAGVRAGGTALRVVQTGYVRTYALAIGAGAVVVSVWFLTRASF